MTRAAFLIQLTMEFAKLPRSNIQSTNDLVFVSNLDNSIRLELYNDFAAKQAIVVDNSVSFDDDFWLAHGKS